MIRNGSFGWGRADTTGNAPHRVDFITRAAGSGTGLAYRQQTYELVGVAPGRRILDLGCGTGSDTLEMARQMDGSGEVVGVDLNEELVDEARKRAAGTGLPVQFAAAPAGSLPFPDNSFDGCRAVHFFQHLSNPGAALAEMLRVARPGAPVVVADPDYGTTVIDVQDRVRGGRVQALISELIANPWSGRRLPGLFRRMGLTDILVHVEFWPFNLATLKEQFGLPESLQTMQRQRLLTAAEVAGFMAELESRTAEGTFFGGTCFFIVAGHKEV